jgi:hypothetical protein
VDDALKKKGADFTVVRSGRDDIAITFKVPSEMSKLDDDLLKPFRRDLDRGEPRCGHGHGQTEI